MGRGIRRLGVWVGMVCVVPLVALAAVLLFNAPTLPTSLAAFMVLGLIAPHLMASSDGGGHGADASKSGVGR